MNRVLGLMLTLVALPAVLLFVGCTAGHKSPAAAQAALDRALALDKEKKLEEALAAFIEAVEADPDLLAVHDRMVDFDFRWRGEAWDDKSLMPRVKAMQKTVDERYAQWERRFPDSIGILYGMGAHLSHKESPKAKSYLLEVLERDPDNAKVYSMLSSDAQRWGDDKAALEYMRKASALEPQNATYAFYYAGILADVEPEKREAAYLDIAERFPDSERGAQALYWLGVKAPDDAKRIAFFEQQRARFPAEKFAWSANGMSALFEAYLRVDPAKAATFAQEMQGGQPSAEPSTQWAERLALAQTYIKVNQQVAAGQAGEAVGLLVKLTTDTYSSNSATLIRLKARVLAEAGKKQAAYDSLLKTQASSPDDETYAALRSTGKLLNKTSAQVDADLANLRDSGATDAPQFELQQYTSNDTVSLERLRGKVVFVTFWFPGCGPCRAEFPHFETVMQGFRDEDVVYLGINGLREQDDYVLPFMTETKYTFTALKGTEEVTEAYKVVGYPTNLLIDRSGRIVYRGFTARDAYTEGMLQRMIQSLLGKQQSARTATADDSLKQKIRAAAAAAVD